MNRRWHGRHFTWKIIQGPLKIGKYWERIPGYENQGEWAECDRTETIDHILFECPLNHGNAVWHAIKLLYSRKNIPWPERLDAAYILTTPILKIKDREGVTQEGASRFLTIATLESAWTIWKTRCGRVINSDQNEP